MKYGRLEAYLQLETGEISAVLMNRGPSYRRMILPPRHKRTKTYAQPKIRSVFSPSRKLKAVQRRIRALISERFKPHPIVHAYVQGRGIVTNARQHVGREWLFHIDLVNFFGSIKEELIVEGLAKLLPDFSCEEIRVIARLCCHEGSLPQGSPASPILSNMVCHSLDERLHVFSTLRGLTVTRYSDDICFSSTNAIAPEFAKVQGRGAAQHIELGASLGCLFEPYGFVINLKKLRFQDRTERQQVTGLVVNDGVNVPKEYYRTVRDGLRLWSARGVDVAARQFERHLSVDRFVEVLRGLIDYIGQVRGRSDDRYRTLLATFKKLRADDLTRLRPS